jgi:glycosyltransferase involved in cell wall biosynthesis
MERVVLDGRVVTGGVGRYAVELVHAMSQMADSPEISLFGPAQGTWDRLVSAPFTPWGRWRVGRFAERWKADVVHGLHLEAPRGAGVPVVVTVHDVIPLLHPASMPNPMRRWIFKRILESSIERAARIIVPSPSTREDLLAMGFEGADLSVIPIGTPQAFRPPTTEEEIISARDRFAGGRQYVALLASSKPHKNAGVLAGVAQALADTDVELVAVGPGIDLCSRNLRVHERLSDADLRTFYGGAAVFLLPSLIEGYGLPALEAAGCGTPVICGPRIGVRPYIADGAVVVDVSKPREIADAVKRLVGEATRREELSQGAREAAHSLTTEAMAQATVAVYQEVLSRS